MEHVAPPSWVGLAYLAAGVLFIMALRGLSSPATSRAGNRYGMIGMTIAMVTTLATHGLASLPEIAGAIAIGGGLGFVTARKIKMTDRTKHIELIGKHISVQAIREQVGLGDPNGKALLPTVIQLVGPDDARKAADPA